MNNRLDEVIGVAGHRARDPPDPTPNSEVKPRSVSGVSVVFGHAKPGKLATPLVSHELMEEKYSKFITHHVFFWKARMLICLTDCFRVETILLP